MRNTFITLAAASLFIFPVVGHADLDSDFKTCRRQIVNIGSDPELPQDQYCLGLSYQFALNHKKNSREAVHWFTKAAEQQHPGAQATLGYMYERGYGVEANPAEAVRWYRQAAEQNHDDGLFHLGRAYENGIGVSRDLNRARTYYSKAANVGSSGARDALANLGREPEAATPRQADFDEGKRLYKAGDYAGAARVFMNLAEQGDPRAQLQIGYQYNYGEGLNKNAREAAKWYRRAAEQGNAAAQSNLGSLYEEGQGVEEDWVEAAKWYRRSAEQGHAAGLFSLGRAYQFGIGVPQSRREAVRWFDLAGDKGHDQANYFANHLRGGGNYIGFRNEDEQALVVGNRLRTVLLNIEPAGRTFHSSAERVAFLRQAAQQADQGEAQQRWDSKKRDYDTCVQAGRSDCIRP